MVNLITDNIDIWASAQTPKGGVGRGNGNGYRNQNAYGIKKLRELILELAVRGKLVPQDPKDEPASVLLKRIAEEKKRLIKGGKIKKQEPLSEISDDEKPFEIPKGWEWTRLGNLSANIHYGYTASADHSNSGIRLLRITDIQNDSVNWETVPGCEIEEGKANDYLLENDDILIARTGGTIGKSYLVENIDVKAVFASYLIRVRRIEGTSAPFTKTYLGSQLYWQQLYENSMGTGQPNVNATALKSLAFPTPPLAEQHRIVAKVDELIALCDQLEHQQIDCNAAHQTLVETLLNTLTTATSQDEFAEAWQRIAEHFDTLFTTEYGIDQLKQTILQLAVMGKLVTQDPNDEPAGVLLEKISKEKARLIKEGIIKKQNPLPQIGKDEKPFEIPKGWNWARPDDFSLKITDWEHFRPPTEDKGVYFLSAKDIRSDGVSLDDPLFVSKETAKKALQRCNPETGDLLVVSRGATVGRMCTVDIEEVFCLLGSVILIKPLRPILSDYLKIVMKTPQVFKQLISASGSTAQPAIYIRDIKKIVFPIAPLAEQHRIIAKVDKLMAICDALKARLNDAQTTQMQLAKAIVEQAVR
jgi:type I restriction enzyme S subunit